ncbi:hypothetical protein VNO78_27023 [Psophocarpus tetragonolobus]|uniref:BHLH domain-containing protein n=1 Tax=Psophocarpus tetragonolobus TaxID=3891 RepID=A0AAN9S1P4_PSOTE
MELSQLGFLDELVAPRRDTWNTLSTGFCEPFPNTWMFDTFLENPSLATSSSLFGAFSAPLDRRFECPYEVSPYPFGDGFTMPLPELDPANDDPPPLPPSLEDEDIGFHDNNNNKDNNFEENKSLCKVKEQCTEIPVFNIGMCDDGFGERKPKSKKLEGQPSKNLMAERRRRKRLNDRLSMLRSIVPKISKMDRTSILGDTIDYMKELLERIGKLQEEEEGTSNINLLGFSKEQQLKPNEAIVRNSPKFDVERRDQDTRISICCATKPGLLLSTVNTLEALGLEIQQCVISSFNDFSMEASCSEVEQRNCINPEEIKQALFRNAGFGGKCL